MRRQKRDREYRTRSERRDERKPRLRVAVDALSDRLFERRLVRIVDACGYARLRRLDVDAVEKARRNDEERLAMFRVVVDRDADAFGIGLTRFVQYDNIGCRRVNARASDRVGEFQDAVVRDRFGGRIGGRGARRVGGLRANGRAFTLRRREKQAIEWAARFRIAGFGRALVREKFIQQGLRLGLRIGARDVRS